MALPFAFSNNTSPTGPQLDSDLAALGKLTPIPCSVAGSNSITMTPNTDTPTVVAYATGMQFSGIASASNTTATQARVGALPLLNVYRDSPTGPIALSGGEVVIGNAFTLLYDAALNSGAGGFHLIATTAGLGAYLLLTGGTLTGALTVPTLNVSTIASLAGLRMGSSVSTISRIVSTSGSLTFTVVPANTDQTQTIALTGAAVNDAIVVGPPASVVAGINFTGHVLAAGTVAVKATNATAASLTPVSGTYRVVAIGGTP